jgi:hypothetical protein
MQSIAKYAILKLDLRGETLDNVDKIIMKFLRGIKDVYESLVKEHGTKAIHRRC